MSVSLWALKLAAALVPAALGLLYFHERTGARAGARVVVAALVLGAGASEAALGLQRLISSSRHISFAWFYDLPLAETIGQSGYHLARAIVYGGGVEEGVKLLAVGAVLWLFRTRLSPGVIVMISIAVAGGFAGVENALYVLNREHWIWTAFLRALLPVPGHMFFGAIMAYFLVLAARGGPWRAAVLFAFLVPGFLHGTGNYLIAVGSNEVDAPDHLEIRVRQIYVALLLVEAVLAVLVARCAGRMELGPGSSGVAAAALWRGRLGLRRFFWIVCGLALVVIGVLHVIIARGHPESRIFEFNVGWPLALGIMALFFGVAFWVHGRIPKPAQGT